MTAVVPFMSRIPRNTLMKEMGGKAQSKAGPGEYTLRSGLEKKSFNLKYNKFNKKKGILHM